MNTPRTSARSAVPITVHSRCVRVDDPLEALLAARDLVGDQNAFLLESLAGPATDTRTSLIGVLGLMEISVHRSVVRIDGGSELVAAVRTKLVQAGVLEVETGGLRLRDDDALWDLPRVLNEFFALDVGPDAFGFGVLAYYGYDAVHYIESLPRTIEDNDRPVPDVIFALVHALVAVDLGTGTAVLTIAESELWAPLDVTSLEAKLADAAALGRRPAMSEVPPARAVFDDVDADEFCRRAERGLEHIRIGDIYQVQLGHALTVTSDVSPETVYRRLRERNPSPYMSFLPIAGRTVVGASPELFLRIEGRDLTMRPIAGTARRTTDRAQDDTVIATLLQDEKERAEHIMLVDLCRNDLGRVARRGSLDVRELMSIESYSHMFHIVSDVSARLDETNDVYSVIRACFPAGTMTGAPKVRAMEIIESLESSRRGLYAGSFGLIGFGGWSVLGLAIRMATHEADRYTLRASAGIVADSVPRREWEETLTKLGATYWAVTGGELT